MPTKSNKNCQIAKRLFLEQAKFFPIALLNLKDVEVEVSGRRAKVRLPDLMVLSEAGYAALQGKTRNIITREMPPPILIVEIVFLAAQNRTRDYRYKCTEYAARGIAEYWIIDPEEQGIQCVNGSMGSMRTRYTWVKPGLNQQSFQGLS